MYCLLVVVLLVLVDLIDLSFGHNYSDLYFLSNGIKAIKCNWISLFVCFFCVCFFVCFFTLVL